MGKEDLVILAMRGEPECLLMQDRVEVRAVTNELERVILGARMRVFYRSLDREYIYIYQGVVEGWEGRSERCKSTMQNSSHQRGSVSGARSRQISNS